MPRKNNDILENFRLYENKKSILEKQEIEKNDRDLVSKILDTKSHINDSLS